MLLYSVWKEDNGKKNKKKKTIEGWSGDGKKKSSLVMVILLLLLVQWGQGARRGCFRILFIRVMLVFGVKFG
jgi:hypothetical protein